MACLHYYNNYELVWIWLYTPHDQTTQWPVYTTIISMSLCDYQLWLKWESCADVIVPLQITLTMSWKKAKKLIKEDARYKAFSDDDHVRLKASSQYDTDASVVSRASGWCWSWLKFNPSIISPVFVSIRPIRLSKVWHQELNLTNKKNAFSCNTHDAHTPSVIILLWTGLKWSTITSFCLERIFFHTKLINCEIRLQNVLLRCILNSVGLYVGKYKSIVRVS